MADTTSFPSQLEIPQAPRTESRKPRPPPLRTRSECERFSGLSGLVHTGRHARHKSTSTASGRTNAQYRFDFARAGELSPEQEVDEEDSDESHEETMEGDWPPSTAATGILTPPVTPDKARSRTSSNESEGHPKVLAYDFSRVDYELKRAKVLGTGLWSVVVLADAITKPANQNTIGLPSPPVSPQQVKRQAAPSSLFAVKRPARKDAIPVFQQEAKTLSHLMRQRTSSQFVVPFHGLDVRNSALVFEPVIGGSLESLNNRLRQMTEISRHLELINIFPGLANDLISGLEFIHAAGVVHADLKPANILLDISEHYSLPRPVIRARYIDFSAAFRPAEGESCRYAGGTWDYMAPEQMRIQKDLSTPTFASDVWSLGITLLSLVVGGSPYTATCGGSVFMVREAIKRADPLGSARADPVARKRMAACQDFMDCCRLALQKERERRMTAAKWRAWTSRVIGTM